MSFPLVAVSVDLDGLSRYFALHGLTEHSPSHAVYDIALPRIRKFASECGLPLTLFAIAADLARAETVTGLRGMLALGHEIGNHSLDHLYDLTLRQRTEQLHQVDTANEQFRALLSVRPAGFRAPGYTVTDELLAVVRECGMAYDSSVFPCPPYYAAKAAALIGMTLRGKRSGSIMDSPRVLRAPTSPYRIGQPYWSRGTGLLELPIQVAGLLRVPFIGTTLSLLGATGARLLARSLIGQRFINLELHGVDFLEAQDVPAGLARVQPDLRVPWARKFDAFVAVLKLLRANGYGFVRFDEAARALS